MKLGDLEKMFRDEDTNELAWVGKCHDCKKDVEVVALQTPEGITIEGGALYAPNGCESMFLKCDACHSVNAILKNYQDTLVYSRVVGYMRPTSNWNDAKQAEFEMRKEYAVPTL